MKTRIDKKHTFRYYETDEGIEGQICRESKGRKYYVPTHIEKMILYPTKKLKQAIFLAKMRHGLV